MVQYGRFPEDEDISDQCSRVDRWVDGNNRVHYRIAVCEGATWYYLTRRPMLQGVVCRAARC